MITMIKNVMRYIEQDKRKAQFGYMKQTGPDSLEELQQILIQGRKMLVEKNFAGCLAAYNTALDCVCELQGIPAGV